MEWSSNHPGIEKTLSFLSSIKAMYRIKLASFLVSTILYISACVRCEECFYIVNNNGSETEDSLGEYCGDETKALEKKEHSDPLGPARVECR